MPPNPTPESWRILNVGFGAGLPARHRVHRRPPLVGFSYSGPQSLSHSLLPTNLPLLSRRLQLPIPLGVDLRLTPGEHVLRGDVANRAVQPDVVVMFDIALHQTPCI